MASVNTNKKYCDPKVANEVLSMMGKKRGYRYPIMSYDLLSCIEEKHVMDVVSRYVVQFERKALSDARLAKCSN